MTVQSVANSDKLTPNKFMLNVLNGMALGIVVGLITNAVLGGLLDYFSKNYGTAYPFFTTMKLISIASQWAVAPLIGTFIGYNFKFTPIQIGCLTLVAYLAAGNVVFANGQFMVKGLGDILNILLCTSITAGLFLVIKNFFGSLSVVILPIIAVVIGYLSTISIVYMREITLFIAHVIRLSVDLTPWLAAPILAMIFAFAIASPLSSVGLSLITSISGVAAGVANLGISAAVIYLIISSFKANKIGVPIVLFASGAKMLVPNLIEKPITYVIMLTIAAATGLYGIALTDIQVTTRAAGFGFIAFIGPLSAWDLFPATMSFFDKMSQILLAYCVVPVTLSLVAHHLCTKVLKFYTNKDFEFMYK